MREGSTGARLGPLGVTLRGHHGALGGGRDGVVRDSPREPKGEEAARRGDPRVSGRGGGLTHRPHLSPYLSAALRGFDVGRREETSTSGLVSLIE